jgi:radical SAM protein with 4Fe4S-binding SPASM domain
VVDVGISLHAGTAVLHDDLAGRPGSFDKALAAVRLLVKCGVKVIIKHSVSSANFGEYTSLQKLADDEGCGFESDPGILPQQQGTVSPFIISREQLAVFLKNMGVAPQTSCIIKKDESILHCDAGRSICGISPAGDVYPCIILPVFFGNLTELSFQKIWYGEKAEAYRREEKNLDKECLSCEMNHLCSRCHGFAWLESGNWRGRSWSLCERAKAMHKALS